MQPTNGHESRRHHSGTERETDRIEAFSDGVFAFAITLLVLNIRIPSAHSVNGSVNLSNSLLHLWPSYFAYLLSFVMIGIYWANHHYVFKLYAKTNHAFNLLNLLFLLFIALLPLPTLTLSEYLLDPKNRTAAATMYASALLLQATTWSIAWLYAAHRGRLIDSHLDRTFVRRLTRQYLGSVALYAVAVAICTVDVTAGLAICVGLTLLYLLPPRSPLYVKQDSNGCPPTS